MCWFEARWNRCLSRYDYSGNNSGGDANDDDDDDYDYDNSDVDDGS